MTDQRVPRELQEVLEYYDEIVSRAPLDDTEWDFVITAAEYRLLRAQLAQTKPVAWREQFLIFASDYNRYVDGDRKMPFSLLRQSLAAFIEECNNLYAAPSCDALLAEVARMQPVFQASMERWRAKNGAPDYGKFGRVNAADAKIDRACDRAARKGDD